jgi:hypothetical protein
MYIFFVGIVNKKGCEDKSEYKVSENVLGCVTTKKGIHLRKDGFLFFGPLRPSEVLEYTLYLLGSIKSLRGA